MILITGNKGFIGQHLTRRLDAEGIKWIGFDLKDGQDINNKLQLETVFDTNPITTVIHLAALTGARRGDLYPTEYFTTNVKGSQNVAFFSQVYGVEKFIAFSSSSAIRNENIYGMSKRAMEHILSPWNKDKTYIIRPFNVYAEDGRKDNVVFKWLSRIKEGLPIEYHGDHIRHFTHIDDLIDGLFTILRRENSEDAIVDFGNQAGVNLRDVLKKFEKKFGHFDINYDTRPDTTIYPSPPLFGWEPKRYFLETVDKILYDA